MKFTEHQPDGNEQLFFYSFMYYKMETPKVFDLLPVNNRKSFYGKCKVIDDWQIAKLQSYSTIVSTYEYATNKLTINGRYSMTTASHINAFLKYLWFDTMTKAEMENYKN